MDVTSLYTNKLQEEGIKILCRAYDYFYKTEMPIHTHTTIRTSAQANPYKKTPSYLLKKVISGKQNFPGNYNDSSLCLTSLAKVR